VLVAERSEPAVPSRPATAAEAAWLFCALPTPGLGGGLALPVYGVEPGYREVSAVASTRDRVAVQKFGTHDFDGCAAVASACKAPTATSLLNDQEPPEPLTDPYLAARARHGDALRERPPK
jgi:hypothetical protein